MTDEEREKMLARAFADLLDQAALDPENGAAPAPPELAGEFRALAEIDRALDPAGLPERLSGHKIATEIGSGGMGRVLLATDEALGRKVAIKTLAARYADNPVLRARFMAEARAMARLSHPNIVRIYSLGPADEPPAFRDGVRGRRSAEPVGASPGLRAAGGTDAKGGAGRAFPA